MKRIFLGVLFFSSLSLAAPGLRYSGTVEMKAASHSSPILGTFQVFDENQKISKVEMVLQKPIYNMSTFTSVEQQGVFSDMGDHKRLGLVFRVKGPTHKWNFVYVARTGANSPDFVGSFYKSAMPMDEVVKLLQEGLPAIPSSWKLVGAGSLKEVP